jgi:hypothetical protein
MPPPRAWATEAWAWAAMRDPLTAEHSACTWPPTPKPQRKLAGYRLTVVVLAAVNPRCRSRQGSRHDCALERTQNYANDVPTEHAMLGNLFGARADLIDSRPPR